MRRITAVSVITGAMLAGSVTVSGPAVADHVVDVYGSDCRWGAYTNPLQMDLWTTDVRFKKDRTGAVTAYTCRFKNIPAYLPADGGALVEPWYLPKKRQRYDVGECWGPERDADGQPNYGTATAVISPRGTAKVKCVL